MHKNAKPGDIPSSGRILGTYSANFGTRESVPTMPSMPSMGEETATLGNGCISFRRQPATNGGSLPVRTCRHDEVGGAAQEDGSPIRKIRAGRGLDAIPTSLPLEGAPAVPWPWALDRGGQNKKKQRIRLTGSHLLPRPEKITRVSKPSSPFHRTLAHGGCCALAAARCLGHSGNPQLQIHADRLPIRPAIARPRVCFHPPIA